MPDYIQFNPYQSPDVDYGVKDIAKSVGGMVQDTTKYFQQEELASGVGIATEQLTGAMDEQINSLPEEQQEKFRVKVNNLKRMSMDLQNSPSISPESVSKYKQEMGNALAEIENAKGTYALSQEENIQEAGPKYGASPKQTEAMAKQKGAGDVQKYDAIAVEFASSERKKTGANPNIADIVGHIRKIDPNADFKAILDSSIKSLAGSEAIDVARIKAGDRANGSGMNTQKAKVFLELTRDMESTLQKKYARGVGILEKISRIAKLGGGTNTNIFNDGGGFGTGDAKSIIEKYDMDFINGVLTGKGLDAEKDKEMIALVNAYRDIYLGIEKDQRELGIVHDERAKLGISTGRGLNEGAESLDKERLPNLIESDPAQYVQDKYSSDSSKSGRMTAIQGMRPDKAVRMFDRVRKFYDSPNATYSNPKLAEEAKIFDAYPDDYKLAIISLLRNMTKGQNGTVQQ